MKPPTLCDLPDIESPHTPEEEFELETAFNYKGTYLLTPECGGDPDAETAFNYKGTYLLALSNRG